MDDELRPLTNEPDSNPAEIDGEIYPPAASKPFIVGIGASAGGLGSLERLFSAVPSKTGMAFVIIQHLSPDFKSLMDELLARYTDIPIHRAEDGMEVTADSIYLIPPKKDMIIANGRLLLTDKDPKQPLSMPIDRFFRSLAQDAGDRAIGVILSGTGSDGSRGIRDIHDAAGYVVCEAKESAQFDGMPLAALETGVVDETMQPEAIPGALQHYIRRVAAADEPSDGIAPTGAMNTLFKLLNDECGIDFSHYKSNTVGRRIQRRLSMVGAHTLTEYVDRLRRDQLEVNALYRDLLIGVTRFFRDREAFYRLERDVIPAIIDKAGSDDEVRVWVAGCATGEEAYSMALLVQRLRRDLSDPPRVRIFATDIDTDALDTARRGLYPAETLQEIPEDWRSEHLELSADTLRFGTVLREMVIFSQHNLLRDPPFLRLDLVSCRNVLIYLQADWQRWLLRHFQRALGDQGLLMLGRSETPCSDERLTHVRPLAQAALFLLKDASSPRDLAAPTLSEAPRPNAPRRGVVQRPTDLGRLLLAAHSAGSLAPGWVMTDQGQLQHTFGDISPLLQLASGGPASLEVPKLCDQRFWLTLRSLVFQARQEPGRPVAGWHHRPEGGANRLSVLAIPQQPLCVVMFDTWPRAGEAPAAESATPAAQAELLPGGAQHELAHLREHVTATQQHLETLVSELDAANEELQMLNEELQSSNEELQSTNEELATSNEELQSTNEELITVNEELQMRTTELALRNADLDNVRNSLLDPLLVVDEHGRVILRNAAAEACWQFDAAIVRPAERPLLATLPCRFDVLPLMVATREVLEQGTVVDLELAWPQDRIFATRIQPYLGRQGERCGAVILMRDITQTARLQRALATTVDELQRSEALRRATVDALPDLICVLDDAGAVTGVNAAWLDQAAQRSQPTQRVRLGVGSNYHEVCLRAAAAGDEHARQLLRGLTAVQQRELALFELTYPCHDATQQAWYRVTITPLQGTAHGVVLRHQNVTEVQALLSRLQLQARALDASPNGIVVCDARQPGLPIIYVNGAFETLTGYTAADVMGRSCAILHGSDRQQAGLVTLRQALAARRPVRVLLRNYRRSGEMFWNELTLSLIEDDAGTVTHMVGVQRDVTALLASEEALRASQRREAQALAFAGLGTLDWRLRDGRLMVSKQQARLFGLGDASSEVLWSQLRERLFADDLPMMEDAVKVCVAGHAALDIEIRLRTEDGSPRWLHLQGNAERDEQGVATHLMAICQDITARRAAEEHATHLSQHDGLTGLPNRSLLRDRLQRAVLQAVRDRSRLALLFIDLDRFKEVNDSLGHEAGDDLLRLAALRLQQAVRDSDTVGRLGGDEFVVLLPQLHSADEARRVADKLLHTMQAPFTLRDTPVTMSASIGVSLYPDDGHDGDELMRHADSAMYRAKGSGRDAVCFFSRDAESSVQLSLANRTGLRQAIARDELVLHFQPQVDLTSGRLCGLEALLRWQHPERGLLHPQAFLAALDEPALAASVGDWVIQAAGRQIAAWRGTPLADVPVSVNVSPLQLRGTSLVRTLNEMLGQTGIRPDRLEIEVTEHALVDSHLGAGDTLRDCHQLGVGIALDDFGTGFSSLSVLHQHPISRIKIDQSFCRRLPDDPKALAIVRAMIDMARNLSVGVLAEGIETDAQARCLREAGCHLVQGYLFARPAEAEVTEAWWHTHQAAHLPMLQ